MKKIFLITCCLLICITSFALPIITTFSPATGPIGSSVTITGTGFNTTANQNIVFFGATQATVTAASATSLTVTVPLGATYQYISVTNLTGNLTAYSVKPFIVTLAGNISFAAKVDFATGTNPNSVSIGDIDGDGKPDLVVTNRISSTISVFRNISTSGAISFAAKVDFTTGTSPSSVSIGDIDGDGKPDLVVANYNSITASVFRNTSTSGTVSFAAKVDFTTGGNNPFSVNIGDIDGDGKPDLAVTNYSNSSVSVLRNTSSSGVISFASNVDFTTGTSPRSVSIGDIDGDGKPDLAVANITSNTVSVLRSTSTLGTISFAAKVDFATGTNPQSVSIGDIDGDGKPDLTVANNISNTVSVFRSISTSGTINFAAKVDFATGTRPQSVSIGDIDGDSKPDLVVANNNSSSGSVFRSTSTSGTVSFAAKVDFATGLSPSSVSIGDIDGDGKPDLAVTNDANNTVSVIRQTVPPPTITSFSPASDTIGSSVTITGTGFSATANQNIVFFGATQAVVTTASTTSLTVTVPFGATYQYISVTNLTDNLTAYSAQPFIVTLAGNVLFAPKVDFTTGTNPVSVSMGDIDGDGRPDLAVANSSSSLISVFRNTSTFGVVSFAAKVDFTSGAGPNSVSIADIDGDGKPDLVVANYSSNTVSVILNTSTLGTISFATKVDFATSLNAYSVSIGDIDGDGKPDLAVANYSNSSVSLFRNTSTLGTISFEAKADFTTGTNPSSLSIGDIDGDSKPDLVVGNGSSSTVSVLRNTSISGAINFAAKVDFATGSTTLLSVSIGDIDGDGKPDLAVANYSSNIVSVFRNTSVSGTISFAAKVDFTTGTQPRSTSIGDIDGDSKPDLVVVNYNSNTASVLRNTSTSGTVSFAAKVDFITGTNPQSVSIGDIDGDGKPDLAVANRTNTTVSILRQIAPLPSITSFTPSSGCANTTSVVITGTNFTGATSVTIGGINVLNFTVNSATQITINVGSTTGTIEVTTANGTGGSAGSFTVNPQPTVSLGIDNTTCGSIMLDAGNAGATYLWSTTETTQAINVLSSNAYSVTVTDGNSCSNADTINITINPLPSVTTTLNGLTIAADQNGAGYQWLDCNNSNQPIAGETNQSFTPIGNGDYAVVVTMGGCSDTSACVNITGVGITTIESSSFSLFPNPTTDVVTLQIDQNFMTANIEIINTLGQVVFVSQTSDALTKISMPSESGVYFVRVEIDGVSSTHKVIKE